MAEPNAAKATHPGPKPAPRAGHKGFVLTVIAAAQLMIVLDATIVNIALPHIQEALDFSTANLSWVINAYTLAFGGLLLLGGRTGDILGRRRVFIFGILLFSFASLIGGFATSPSWLLAARALQGIGGAIASPTSLSLISTNFSEGTERNRAFGVYAGVSASGAAIGLVAGGMLTSWLSWRWVLFVNVPIGIVLALLVPLYINESERHPGKFDIGGALASTLGMVALVYGFIRASEEGWLDRWTIASFVAAAVLLSLFILDETTAQQPITPLRMFADRNRSASYAIMLCLAAALYSMFFFLTLFVQEIMGYSPLRAGFAFVPISLAIMVNAQIVSRALPRFGPKPFMVLGTTLATAGLFWLSQISSDSQYWDGLLLPMIIFGSGMGLLFVALTIVALSHVEPWESGAASGTLNTMQQVGGSLGLAILVTIFGTASRHESDRQIALFMENADPEMLRNFQETGELPPPYAQEILSHGISTAFQAAVLFGAVGFLLAVFAIRAKASDLNVSEASGGR